MKLHYTFSIDIECTDEFADEGEHTYKQLKKAILNTADYLSANITINKLEESSSPHEQHHE